MRARRLVITSAGLLALAAAAVGAHPSPGVHAQTAAPAALVSATQQYLGAVGGVPAAQVSVVRAEPVVWANGCLGVSTPGTACTQALVEGWVVWASMGGYAYRVHTDRGAEAGAPGATIKLAASNLPLASVAADPLPAGATPRGTGTAKFAGKVPASGQLALLVTEGAADAGGLAQALTSSGCTPLSLAVIEAGAWRVYVVGAPPQVNAAFPSTLPDTTPFAVRCS